MTSSSLVEYYDKIYPFEDLTKWLTKFSPLLNREFSFTLQGEIFLRHKAYETLNTMKADIIKLSPLKFDIGAIYDSIPKKTSTSESVTVTNHELIFDIDISDYDDLRSCCKEKSICSNCWIILSCTMKYTDFILKGFRIIIFVEIFNFKNIIWFFSGRRGVHCWVCDPICSLLDSTSRKAIVNFLHSNDAVFAPKILYF